MDNKAAAYVLGFMSMDERAAFEKDLEADPSLQGEVDFWLESLAQLNTGYTKAKPKVSFTDVARSLWDDDGQDKKIDL